MKKVFLPFLVSCFISPLAAQVNIAINVATDKSVYLQGDTITIFVRAINKDTQADTLRWPSTCQANCYVDGFDWSTGLGCYTTITSNIIQPSDSFTWSFSYPRKNSGLLTLSPGQHKIVGEVIGYGKSDTILISVSPTTEVAYNQYWLRSFSLRQNYPNPFNPTTRIRFSVAHGEKVLLQIHSLLGQLVYTITDAYYESGEHELQWTPDGLPTGVYIYTLHVKSFTESKRLIFIK